VFRRNFGLAETERRELPALGIRAATLPIGRGWIGIVTPLPAESAVARFLERRGEGLYLISLAVGDLDHTSAALAGAGVRVTEPIAAGTGSRVAFISPRSALGTLIQLVEQRGAA
jgi:methylmalonyl-CoA/ethylmalonyl-CoA epimerase